MGTIVFKNFHLLDGTEFMQDRLVKYLEVKEGKITRIGDFEPEEDSLVYDLDEQYLIPGLINLHVHLPSTGKPSKKKLGDASKLVKLILSNNLFKKIGIAIEKKSALVALNSGVTTMRSVGGVGDIDTILRDQINSGKVFGPRILASNTGIGVPGGHMDKTVAVAANSLEEAKELVRQRSIENVDLIKLMITGGVLDSSDDGTPAQLRMHADMIKVCCDEAHSLGFKVAAHVESPEGIKLAIENGVDSIEHGAALDDNLINILKVRNGAIVLTLSPALPFVLLDPKTSPYGEVGYNCAKIVLKGFIECGKACLEHGVTIGLGTDAGSAYTTHYNFWRELQFFTKYIGATPTQALYTATLGNAKIACIDNETGSIEVGKSADLVVVKDNPLKNKFRTLADPQLVMIKGQVIRKPHTKKFKEVDDLLEKAM